MGEGQKPKAPAVKREAGEFRRNGPRIDHSYHIDTELAFTWSRHCASLATLIVGMKACAHRDLHNAVNCVCRTLTAFPNFIAV